jgi:hypothetical protein
MSYEEELWRLASSLASRYRFNSSAITTSLGSWLSSSPPARARAASLARVSQAPSE